MNTSSPTLPPTCGNCGVEERRILLLHHVRHRGLFRRLCTSCVLKLHPQSFCPTCFLVYTPPLPPSTNDTVSCLKCDSFSHSHCVQGPPNNDILHPTPYTCPPCANPNVPIFDASKRELDKRGAKVLLAAVRVAAGSMSKAALGARAEAEKRAKEAAFARKRAREALEHVAFLVAREKVVKRKESVAEVSVARGERNHHKAAPITELNRVGNQRVVDGVDGPNEVSARLNAVGLREKDRLQGFGGQIAVSGTQNNFSGSAVENTERPRVSPASNVGAPFTQNIKNERSDNLGHLENNNAQGEKVSNGLFSVLPVGDPQKHVQSNHGREEKMGSQQ